MTANFALAYADSVNRQVCDEVSADFQALVQLPGAMPQEIEREFAAFLSELQHAALETRRLIAEIDALTR